MVDAMYAVNGCIFKRRYLEIHFEKLFFVDSLCQNMYFLQQSYFSFLNKKQFTSNSISIQSILKSILYYPLRVVCMGMEMSCKYKSRSFSYKTISIGSVYSTCVSKDTSTAEG